MNIKVNNSYTDERGSIEMILESCKIGSISRISTEANHGRASHYHLSDGHWIIVNEGQIEIYERPVDSQEPPVKTTLNKGDIHFTGPMIEHYMWMPCFTVFDCYSILPRDTENYEKSTVRFTHNLREIYNTWKFNNAIY
jgi:hypothetical protein